MNKKDHCIFAESTVELSNIPLSFDIEYLHNTLIKHNRHMKHTIETNNPINFILDNPKKVNSFAKNECIPELKNYQKNILDSSKALNNMLSRIDDILELMTDINFGNIPSEYFIKMYTNFNMFALSLIICGASFVCKHCYFRCYINCELKCPEVVYGYIHGLMHINSSFLYEICNAYDSKKNDGLLLFSENGMLYELDVDDVIRQIVRDEKTIIDKVNDLQLYLGQSLIHDQLLLMLENLILTEKSFENVKINEDNQKFYDEFNVEYKSIIEKAKHYYELVEKHTKGNQEMINKIITQYNASEK